MVDAEHREVAVVEEVSSAKSIGEVFVRPENLVAMWLRSYPFLWASQCIWLSGLNIVPVFETY